MDIFNLNLPPEDEENKHPKLDSWFDFMNNQMEKMKEADERSKINNLLIENEIDLIKNN